MKSQQSITIGVHRRILFLANFLAWLILPASIITLLAGLTFGIQAQALHPVDLFIPTSLAKITTTNEGSPGNLFIVIGETHVDLKIQRNMADLLSYLHGAYGMNLVCTEGTDAFPDMTFWRTLSSRTAARTVADERLQQRQMNAVEHFAMTHPLARIVGVEDMQALKAHSLEMDNDTKAKKQWSKDFANFIKDDLASLKVTQFQVQRFQAALEGFLKDRDFQKLVPALYDVVGQISTLRKKLKDLADREAAASRLNKIIDGTIPSTEDPLFLARDSALVRNSLKAAGDGKIIALVVGKAHLYGIETLMRQQKISFVSVVPVGVEEELRTSRPSGVSEEEWLKQLKKEADVYENWKKGAASGEIEQYLERLRTKRSDLLKPPPASSRPSFQDESILMSLPIAIQELARRGKSPMEIRNAVLPYENAGFRVLNWSPIGDGFEVLVEKNGTRFWVVHTSSGRTPPPGYDQIGTKPLGGGQLILCADGGGSISQPPFTPTAMDSPWPNPDFNNSRNVVIYKEDKGEVWRYIGLNARPLGISHHELSVLMAQFESAPPGPERILSAQKLCDVIFARIEADLPDNERAIVHTSQDDVLKNHTLIKLSSFAGGHSYPRIQNLTEDRVLRWRDFQNPLLRPALLKHSQKVQSQKMVIWFTKSLEQAPGLEVAKQRLQGMGIKVNEPIQAGDSLVVFGTSSSGPWEVALSDGSTFNSARHQSSLGRAASVAGFGVEYNEELRFEQGSVMTMDALSERQIADGALEIGEAMVRGRGEKSLEQSLREIASDRLKNVVNLADCVNLSSVRERLSTVQQVACLNRIANNNY
jgi:hypothetical protein